MHILSGGVDVDRRVSIVQSLRCGLVRLSGSMLAVCSRLVLSGLGLYGVCCVSSRDVLDTGLGRV